MTRSLAACEGALLLVDASQGVEAQTLANAYLAVENNLEIIPVINKIDLPSAQPEEARRQIEEIIGLDGDHAILASAKAGTGVPEILEAIVARLPPPAGDPDAPLKALIFDSWYDPYRGVVIVVRVIDGVLRPGMKIRLMAEGQDYEVAAGRRLHAEGDRRSTSSASARSASSSPTSRRSATRRSATRSPRPARPTLEPFPGFKELKPMVFAGLYPVEGHEYPELRDALEKLRLNDASFFYEPETSVGARLRLPLRLPRPAAHGDRAGAARARVRHGPGHDGAGRAVPRDDDRRRGAGDRQPGQAARRRAASTMIEEPVITAMILTPAEHVGGILQLCQDKRGVQKTLEYLASDRVLITYELPFNEVVLDFYDKLKTISRGYASLDYHVTGYWPSPLVKLDILVNGDPVDALSIIVHRDMAYERGRALASKMRELIPRQMFEVAIQAAIGGRIIARESVKALRKNVLAKCYGGDISRKRKLLEKQKEGKKRMKRVGKVEIPQEAFLAVLKMGTDSGMTAAGR